MVNFRGALRGLGQGLAYLGQQGLEEQQRVAADARLLARERAFAQFQSGVRTAEAEAGLDREITEMKLKAPHELAKEQDSLTVREPFAERAQQRTVVAEENRDTREQGQEIEREQRGEARTIRAENRATAQWEDRETRRLAREGDDVVGRYVNGDQRLVLVTRSGAEVVSTGTVRQTRSQDDEDEGEDGPALVDVPAVASRVAGAARTTPRSGGTLTPRSPGRGRGGAATARVGQIVENARGQRFRVGPGGQMIPLGR